MSASNLNGAFDPLSLSEDIVTLESIALFAQARALVVERQQDAASYVSDPQIAARISDGQEWFRSEANYYLNALIHEVIKSPSDALTAAALVKSLPPDPSPVLDAVISEFDQFSKNASLLSQHLKTRASAVISKKDSLEKALQRLITELQGPNGELSKTRAAINEKLKALDADLEGIQKGANETGKGVTSFISDKVSLVTGSFSKFGSGGGDTTDKSTGGFSVEGVGLSTVASGDGTGETAQGVEDMSAALSSYKTDLKAVANLYQDFARQKTELAVAVAVSDQADNFARSMNSAAAAAAKVAVTWQSVGKNLAVLRDSSTGVAGTANASAPAWSALMKEMAHVQYALSGQATIPTVDVLLD